MSKVNRPYRIAASALFLMAAASPILAWGGYLFAVDPSNWSQSLEYSLSSENDARYFFVILAIAAVFSLTAAFVVAVQKRRYIVRGVLVGGVVQCLAYAAVGAWFLSIVAASPLWWVYKLQHEI